MGVLTLEEPFGVLPDSAPESSEGPSSMNLLWCVIRPERLDAVKEALTQAHVVGGMTITEVRGFGRQKGHVEHYRGEEYVIRFLPKIRVDIAVRREDLERTLTAVAQAARTGQVGDGKIFVVAMRHALRIRTGERGMTAL